MPMKWKLDRDDNYDGPVERGNDGKMYRKGEAPHSAKWHEEQSKTPASNDEYTGQSNWHTNISSGKRQSGGLGSVLDSLFGGKKRMTPEQQYKEFKRRLARGAIFTDETIRFFYSMGWESLVEDAYRNMAAAGYDVGGYNPKDDPYKKMHERAGKEEESTESSGGFMGGIFGRKKSEAEIIAENWLRVVPDMNMRDAGWYCHPDRISDPKLKPMAEEIFKELANRINKRDKGK